MKKILHLSDLHLGFGALHERFQHVVDQIIATMRPASDYVVLITGDLVEKARGRHQYREARDGVDALEGAGFKTLVAPGNHDYKVGPVASKKFVPRFKETFYGDPHVPYPRVDIIDSIAFIGLDSMAEELHWYDAMFADGELGETQIRRLDDLLGDSTIRTCTRRVIYLHHHPFALVPFSRLKDSHKLGAIVARHGNVDALLFGHHHMGRVRHGEWGVPRCYDGGTSTGKMPGSTHQRVIHLDRPPEADFDADLMGDFDDS
ncbi:MAG: metallophosphoesterase family protein [Anaerolineae bacterium]